MTSTSVNWQGSRTPLSERRRHTEGAGSVQPLPIPPMFMIHKETPPLFVYYFSKKCLIFIEIRAIIHIPKQKEDANMKTVFYIDGRKTTRKAVRELVGEERLKQMLAEAKEDFLEDSCIATDYHLGRYGMLSIRFC